MPRMAIVCIMGWDDSCQKCLQYSTTALKIAAMDCYDPVTCWSEIGQVGAAIAHFPISQLLPSWAGMTLCLILGKESCFSTDGGNGRPCFPYAKDRGAFYGLDSTRSWCNNKTGAAKEEGTQLPGPTEGFYSAASAPFHFERSGKSCSGKLRNERELPKAVGAPAAVGLVALFPGPEAGAKSPLKPVSGERGRSGFLPVR